MTHILKKGFTLIELLVVISIIAVLSSLIVTNLADARVRAENANVQKTAYQYVIALNQLANDDGEYPYTENGYFCLGGNDCSYEYDSELNNRFGAYISGSQNPNQTTVLFDGAERRAGYLRCQNSAECENDSVTEIVWFMKGTGTACGYGSTPYYDEGNTACVLHIEGETSLVNDSLSSPEIDIEGCTDPNSPSYNAEATVDDGSCGEQCYDSNACNYQAYTACEYESCGQIQGCTDSNAQNYDPNANYDDGSCTYYCSDANACNPYAPAMCDYSCNVYGCTDSNANNYNSEANVDDGSCQYYVAGCMDPSADNYNPAANMDDGSCSYGGGGGYDVYGCTNSGAGNYNPYATIDDGSCSYFVSGCTNSSATNYNPSANYDDGSCYFPYGGCTDPNAANYDPSASYEDGSCYY